MQCNSCRPRRWSRLRSCCLHLQRLPMRCCCGSSIGFIGESRRPRARLRRQLRNDQGLAAQREPGERFGLLESFWRFKLLAPLEPGLVFEFVVPAGLLPVPVVFPGLLVAAPELAEPPEAAPLVPAALPPLALPPPPAPPPPAPPPPPPPWASTAVLSTKAERSASGESLLPDIVISFFRTVSPHKGADRENCSERTAKEHCRRDARWSSTAGAWGFAYRRCSQTNRPRRLPESVLLRRE